MWILKWTSVQFIGDKNVHSIVEVNTILAVNLALDMV